MERFQDSDTGSRIEEALTDQPGDAPSSKYFRIARMLAQGVSVSVEAGFNFGSIVSTDDELAAELNATEHLASRLATRASYADFANGNDDQLKNLIGAIRGNNGS